MPNKPLWYAHLDQAIQLLESSPEESIDRSMLESVLKVSRRRAQQILRPFSSHKPGKRGLAPRVAVLQHFKALIDAGEVVFERERRNRWRSEINKQVSEKPMFVEAPVAVARQQFSNLPTGIQLTPHKIVIEGFATAVEANEKLLALAMAIANDLDGFAESISVPLRMEQEEVPFTV